jgi:molecular chaperone GrpE (heat shock protein)
VQNKKKDNPSEESVKDTISRLDTLKRALEQEIEELKMLLDETENSLELMDSEFEKMKGKVLVHVSRALDSAFQQYKKSIPNWSIY